QQRTHPLGVAARQVVVDGDDVHAATGDRVAGGGDRSGQRLALTGGHLDHVAGQHPQRGQQLDVERPHLAGPFGGHPGDRQELRDVGRVGQILQLQEFDSLLQLVGVQRGGLLVELLGGSHLAHGPVEFPVGAGAEQLPEPVTDTTWGTGLGFRHINTVRGDPSRSGECGRPASTRPRHAGFACAAAPPGRRPVDAVFSQPRRRAASHDRVPGSAVELEPFSPSIDWAGEWWESLKFIALTWTISAAGVLLICVLLGLFTVWGRQFWRITGGYFVGRDSLPVWGLFAVLLLSVVASVRLNVLLSYYSNDLYSALQSAFQGAASGDEAVRDSGVSGFWFAIWVFVVLATVHVARTMLDIYLMQRFIIRWRVWLTDRLTTDWLDNHAYYRARFIDRTIDNPDQRIQPDIDIFTTGYGTTPNVPSYGTGTVLLFGAVESVVSVVSFAAILWNLSGPLSVPLIDLTIPRALFWIAIAFVIFATVVAFWIGRPLIRLSFRNEAFNAAVRYALVRLRDAAEAVGFYRGERAEKVELDRRFNATILNYRRWVARTIGFTGWNLTMSQAINPLPIVVQAPRLFNGEIALGAVMQSASAFGEIQNGLSFFRNAYDNFASYRAAIIRLHGLVEANEAARAMGALETAASTDGSVELSDVEVRTPTGRQLIEPLNLRLERGESLVITGRSGAGKTTLLRSLAQLWPYATGTLRRPADRD